MSKYVNTESCVAAGIDPEKLELLCRKLEKVTKELKNMGISIFGASGECNLVIEKYPSLYYVVADNFSI